MLNIYLARHGQDHDNANGLLNGRRDTPLTEIGIRQAHEVAEKIKHAALTFDVVYSSPLQRAFRTAEIISETLGLPLPTAHPDLAERIYGVMTGMPIKDIETMCAPHILKAGLITYFITAPEAETWPDVRDRAKRVLDEIKEKHPEGSVLLVTHGDLGKMLYAAYYDLEWETVLKLFHFGNSELLLLSEDSTPEDAHVFTIAQYNV